jgi:hypothetical protein
MTKNKKGLIINVSSFGGKMFLFNPVYGIGKAGCDRMAADCAIELKVTFLPFRLLPEEAEFEPSNLGSFVDSSSGDLNLLPCL